MALSSFYAAPQSEDSPELRRILHFDYKLDDECICPSNMPRYSSETLDLVTTVQTGGLYRGWFVWNTSNKIRIPVFRTNYLEPHKLLEKHLGQSMKNLILIEDSESNICILPELYHTEVVSNFCKNIYSETNEMIDGFTFTRFEDDFKPSHTNIKLRVVADTSANHMMILLREMYGTELTVMEVKRTSISEDDVLYDIEFKPKIYTPNCHLISGFLRQKKLIRYHNFVFTSSHLAIG